jgi:hypothetical protein
MIKVVVVDLVPVLGILHGEVVAGADEEEVPHHVPDHPLVEEPVVHVLPVSVLKYTICQPGKYFFLSAWLRKLNIKF